MCLHKYREQGDEEEWKKVKPQKEGREIISLKRVAVICSLIYCLHKSSLCKRRQWGFNTYFLKECLKIGENGTKGYNTKEEKRRTEWENVNLSRFFKKKG